MKPIYGKSNDDVNRPNHYTWRMVECSDLMDYWLDKWSIADSKLGFRWGNIFKYLYRSPMKNKEQDIKKAIKYREQIIKMTDDLEYVSERWNDLIRMFDYSDEYWMAEEL